MIRRNLGALLPMRPRFNERTVSDRLRPPPTSAQVRRHASPPALAAAPKLVSACSVLTSLRATLVGLVLPLLAGIAMADDRDSIEELETPNYLVRIEVSCETGGGCEDARYISTNKKTGKSLTLNGTPTYRVCDGGGPCQFTGYQFRSGLYTYKVSVWGVLTVMKGSKTVLREEGTLRLVK